MIHFYFDLPNVADWISVILTFIGLLLAVYAYFHWIRQKEWDLLVESISLATTTYEYLDFKYSIQSDSTLFNEEDINKTDDIPTRHLMVIINKKQKKLKDYEPKIRTLNARLEYVFNNNDNIVCQYYSTIVKLLDQLNRIETRIFALHSLNKALENDDTNDNAQSIKENNEKIRELNFKTFELPEETQKKLENMLIDVKKFKIRKF